MATYTTNYNLEKPEASDPSGDFRESYNDNLDIIDAYLGGGGGGGGGAVYMGAELLWEGSFSGTGTIDVPNLDQYLVIAVQNDVSVLVIGNNCTGAGAIGLYNANSMNNYAYRFNNSVANKLTVDSNNRGLIRSTGATTAGGGEWCTITKIYGLVKKSGADGRGGTTYTTTEQVVGTYLGKPLYQITLDVDNPTRTQSGSKYFFAVVLNRNDIEYGQLESLVVYDSAYSRWCNLPYQRVNSSENIESHAYVASDGSYAAVALHLTSAPYNITKIRCTIRYTKTTD